MLKKKCTSLLLPYIIWNVIMFILVATSNFSHRNGWGDIKPWELYRIFWAVNDGYIATSILGYQFSILCTPINGPLWFVRDLMVVMTISPLFYWIIKHIKHWSPVLFILPYLLHIGVPIKGFGLVALCFFPMGMYFSVMNLDIFELLSRFKKYIISLAFILFLSFYIFSILSVSCHLLKEATIIIGIATAMLIAYTCAMRNSKLNKRCIKLGETSFWIYVMHTTPFISPLQHVFAFTRSISYVGETIYYCALLISKIVLCILTYYALKHICPKFLSFLIGGR